MHRFPAAAPSSTLPSASTSCGTTPKNGRVAEPGLSFVAPGSGVIRMPPVSVCHQVSTIGQRSRSEEHTSELQSPDQLACRLLLEKKLKKMIQLFKELAPSSREKELRPP